MEREYRLGLYEKAMPDLDSWEEKLCLAADSGFDWLEISVDESDKKLSRLYGTGEELRAIRQAVEHTSVPIHTMCLSAQRKYPMGSRDGKIRARSMEILERAIDMAAQLGIRLIQLAGYDVYYEKHGEDTRRYFEENLALAAALAARAGVTLGFETMETPFMDTVGKSMHYVTSVCSPYLGVYPDLGNLKNAAVLYGSDVTGDLKQGAGHILAAHLKETRPGIYRDMRFGSGGHTEYVPGIAELWKQGVRMFTGEFWDHGEGDYRRILREASAFLHARIEEGRQLATGT